MDFLEPRNTIFAIVSSIEVDLRDAIHHHLETQMALRKLLGDKLVKCQERFALDPATVNQAPEDAPLRDLLNYTDLGDQVDLLNKHRQLLPNTIGEHVREVTGQITSLIPIRNRVFHSRPLIIDDLSTVLSTARQVSAAFRELWQETYATLQRLKTDPEFVLGLKMPSEGYSPQQHNLPLCDFDETGFIGRETEMKSLAKQLRGPYPVISIIGVGGVGKTALALKVAYDLLDDSNSPFEAIIWASAKTTQMTGAVVQTIKDAITDSHGLFVELSNVLGSRTGADPIQELLEYLQVFKVLVIIDNLETVLDDRIIGFFREIPTGSKILITSRIGLGAFDLPTNLSELTLSDSVRLLRAVAKARVANELVEMPNPRLEEFCRRLSNNPGFIKWFVSTVQAGVRPEEVLSNQDMFIEFCMENIYDYLDENARLLLYAFTLVDAFRNQAELAFLTELEPLSIRRAIQDLESKQLLEKKSQERSGSFDTVYSLSAIPRKYLLAKHPPSEALYRSLIEKEKQLVSSREEAARAISPDLYNAFHIELRSDGDLVVARYLIEALRAWNKKDFVTATNRVQQAKDLSPDYYEVYRVEAWIEAAQAHVAAATFAYEAALEINPNSSAVRFFFGQFLLRHHRSERAREQLKVAHELDPDSNDVRTEYARTELYLHNWDKCLEIVTPICRNDTPLNERLSERRHRIAWDLQIQVHRRRGDHALTRKDNFEALEAYELVRKTYESCPTWLRDRKMAETLSKANSDLRALENRFSDTEVKNRVRQLQVWFSEIMASFEFDVPQYTKGQLVTGTVVAINDNGFTVDIGAIALLPFNQIDIRQPENLEAMVGQEISALVLKTNSWQADLIISCRERIIQGRTETQHDIHSIQSEFDIHNIQMDQVITGVVSRFFHYGVFVNLGGIDGLLHISEMSWGRIEHPSEMVEVGDSIDVKVLSIDIDKGRISLGLKQLTTDPWVDIEARYPIGTTTSGVVEDLHKYGAFIQMEEEISGLLHISEMSWDRIEHPSDLVEAGDSIEVKVLSIDREERRIALSLKQLTTDPWGDIEARYPIGTTIRGVVLKLYNYGAFIQIGEEISGLLHISEMSWGRIERPSEMVESGDSIDVKVLSIDREERRIALSLKQLTTDPWVDIEARYPIGTTIRGVVENIVPFGAFIKIEEEISGLLHISEMSWADIEHPSDLVEAGDSIEVKVLSFDHEERKIEFSLKQLTLKWTDRPEGGGVS